MDIKERIINILNEEKGIEPFTISWPMTTKGFQKLEALDKSFINTVDYMGVASFWSSAYKHGFRQADGIGRKKAHNAFMKAKLDVSGESEEHIKILKQLKIY